MPDEIVAADAGLAAILLHEGGLGIKVPDRFDIFSGFDIRDEFSDPCSGRHVVLHRGFRVLYRSIHTIWQ